MKSYVTKTRLLLKGVSINMKKFELGIKMYETSYVTGRYVTKDGQVVNHHFDKMRFVTDMEIVKELVPLITELIPEGTEILAGNVLGGVALATAAGLETGLNTVLIRKKAVKGSNLVEGSDVSGKKVCIITDMVTSADAVMVLVNELKELGANVDTVICALRKTSEAPDLLAAQGITLKHVFTMNYLKQLVGD